MRAYVDTNILVDLVLARQEFLPNAQRVFALGYAGEVQLVVSAINRHWQSINDQITKTFNGEKTISINIEK